MGIVISISTRQPVVNRDDFIAELHACLCNIEAIQRTDRFLNKYKLGRLEPKNVKKVTEIRKEWARIRSSAPHIGNDDWQVNPLQEAFWKIVLTIAPERETA